eukprot:12776825-Prorocentrum_lima.AAC.1
MLSSKGWPSRFNKEGTDFSERDLSKQLSSFSAEICPRRSQRSSKGNLFASDTRTGPRGCRLVLKATLECFSSMVVSTHG